MQIDPDKTVWWWCEVVMQKIRCRELMKVEIFLDSLKVYQRIKMSVETEIALLKREVDDMKGIHSRLDTAIEKIADVSSSLHTVIAV